MEFTWYTNPWYFGSNSYANADCAFFHPNLLFWILVPYPPHPMFGFSIYLFGGIVSFASKQLKIVAFSSCEAEYAASAYACKEITFIRGICSDMGFVLHGELILLVDNSASVDVAFNMGVTARTKHFDICIHYFRDEVQKRRIIPIHISNEYQRADGFTKGLPHTTI